MDPWRDQRNEPRPKDERKFSMKSPVDRTIVFCVAGVVAVLFIILIVLILVVVL